MKSLEEIAYEINQSEKKIIILFGEFENFFIHNLSNDNNYSYLDFNSFLKVNNIDTKLLSNPESESHIRISIDDWTRKIAYKEQKTTIIIDEFNLTKIDSLLTKTVLQQELLYLSINPERLRTKLVFVISNIHTTLEKQILPKIITNCKVITY